ncbi:MAG: hypothetical protein WA425_19555, partial [Xanthobacteraceae bacterium]
LWIGWLADLRHRKRGGKQNALFDITRGRSARAGTGSYCIRPREAGEGDHPQLAQRAKDGGGGF